MRAAPACSRLGLLAGACGVLWSLSACSDPVLEPVEYPPTGEGPSRIRLNITKDVDVLFVIDNSGSMTEEQAALAADIGAFLDVLERPEQATNYRIGFTTTDNGNPWCTDTTPEAGALQLSSCRSRPEEFILPGVSGQVTDACSDACPEQWTDIEIVPTTVWGDEEATPRPWIERLEGRTNLPEGLSVTQALQCVAPQGINGCGFESPLESMWRALRRAQTYDDPAFGFTRDNAILSIIHVTDEEDCSANPEWESIFLPEGNRVFWSDPDAESPTSAVCWNAGVICEGSGTYDDCRPANLDEDGAEVSTGAAEDLAVLHPISRYVDLLEEIEHVKQEISPDQEVLVSVIGGVSADGSVSYADSPDDPTFQQDFGIGPGCESSNGRAVPPVRLRELADAFAVGMGRTLFSVCDSSYAESLATIAQNTIDQIKPICIPACVADMEPETPDVLDPSCSLVQDRPRPDGSFEEVIVPPCETGGEAGVVPAGADVCFEMLVGDERSAFCTDEGFNLELEIIRREGAVVLPGTATSVVCNLSQHKSTDCPDLP